MFKAPSFEEFEAFAASAPERHVLVPKCSECQAPMKPHSMFFDEAYSEHYYRKDSVDSFVEQADVLVVVGTALATTMAK